MEKCFVIQPFDNGKFDKRFDEVLVPAIVKAKLAPYRVDRDADVNIPIEDIQAQIEASRLCLADITNDNPNVWFEIGYAIASGKDVVLICSAERESQFPFDVRHRKIIRYKSESKSDFERLEQSVTERLLAILKKSNELITVAQMSQVALVNGLSQFELAALVTVAQRMPEPGCGHTSDSIRDDMEKVGFTALAATIGVSGLLAKDFVESFEASSWNDSYTAYRVSPLGLKWLSENTHLLKLTHDQQPSVRSKAVLFEDDGDEVPF